MDLNSLDVLVLAKLAAHDGEDWTQSSLAAQLGVAQSQVHASLRRAQMARLYVPTSRRVAMRSLAEFLIHGVKYAYPVVRGGLTRGIPTGYAAPPLDRLIVQSDTPPPVWPDPEGTVRGFEFSPIDRRAPRAVAVDHDLYEILALTDAIREGRPREAKLAIEILQSRLGGAND